MTYDYVIILCASLLNDGKFDELSADGSYLGGQVRMQAAADFFKTGKVKKLIVVGGGMEKKQEKEKWQKVNDMRKFLIKNEVPKEKIIRVASKADTHGNLRAIYLTLRSKLDKKTVGILTNFYHIPRAMRFAQDPQFRWNVKFIPISAESVANSASPTFLRLIPEFMTRIIGDIVGLRDWENESYRNQTQQKWKGQVHPDDIRNSP